MTPTFQLRWILSILVAILMMAPAVALPDGVQEGGHDSAYGEMGQAPIETQSQQQGQPQQGGQQPNGTQPGPPDDSGPPEDRPGPPDEDRRPVDPVAIRDHAQGFRTEPPAGSLRPEIDVDAARGTASLHRDDVSPLAFQLDALIEFIDENGNGVYEVGEPVIQRIPLRDARFGVISDPENESRDIVYPLGEDGRLVLRFDLGQRHGPQVGTKFDVIIEGFPFQEQQSLVAIGMRVQSPAGLRIAEVATEEALVGHQGTQVPYLSWEGEVFVDGAAHRVGSSVHLATGEGDRAESAIVYWAYPQGAFILHDPILGVTQAVKDLLGQMTPFVIGFMGALVLMGAGYLARRRTRL